MTEATIIMIPKEGKDPLQTASYRPISLLCADVKLLAKILASRGSKRIHTIIHPDQFVFILLFMLSINAVKAFDSIEWHYLWSALSAFNIGPVFTKWVRLLCTDPRAKVKINERVSECFFLFRGARQGCAWSPWRWNLWL